MTGSPLVCLKASSIWWSSDARQLVCRSMGAIPPTLWSASKPCFSAAIPRNATVPSSTMDADVLGICSYLENTWFKLRQLRMCTVPTGKKTFGSMLFENPCTVEMITLQTPIPKKMARLGPKTAWAAQICDLALKQHMEQLHVCALIKMTAIKSPTLVSLGGKQELIHFLNAPVAAWCFW